MSLRFVVSVMFVLTMPLTAARAAGTLGTEVPVRVYDSTGGVRQVSLDVAASILSAASVELAWYSCASPNPERDARCDAPLQPGDLSVRIVRHPPGHDRRFDLPLGDAFVDTRAHAGVLATLYWDRVVVMSRQTGADRHVLLGRAIAHELGHLLMGTSEHGAGGLMRAVWSSGEIRRSRTTDWIFGPPEVAAIKARTRLR